jgi:phage tail-like protein
MNAPALEEKRDANFLYLNRDNRWLGFQWRGLELDECEGLLTLATVPRLQDAEPPSPATAASPHGIAGVAVGPDGSVYFSDLANHRASKIDGCDGATAPAPCVGGEGPHPTQFRRPRGMIFHPIRRALLVADSGNDRIQVFEINSFQLLDVWEGLDDPRSLAVDLSGNVYVVESGSHRVRKFDMRGAEVEEFWENAQKKGVLKKPAEVAIDASSEAANVHVLDHAASKVFVFDRHGVHLEGVIDLKIEHPMGLAVKGDALYVGDTDRKRIFKFKRSESAREWGFVGEAIGYHAPVAALAVTENGVLLAHPGGDHSPARLDEKKGYVKRGFLWGGPFVNPSLRREQWHKLRGILAALPPGTHIQLFVYPTDGDDEPQTPASGAPPWKGGSEELSYGVETLHHPGGWRRPPLDVAEFVFSGAPAHRVWVGAEFISEDGLGSPSLSQIRLDFDHEKLLQYLPAIYSENPAPANLLARFLSLFGSFFGELEREIGRLSRLFDPEATPEKFLSWLAGWLALEIEEEWRRDRKREAIAKAIELYAWRGTVAGLRQALRFFAGVEAHIEEPLLQSNWWALPADEDSPESGRASLLGFTTMLVAAEAQGAVVGTTAALDQSHLIRQEKFGAPLFDDVAHRFSVRLYRGGSFGVETGETARAVLDREKPAHTDYHLCVVEPNLRIGFQSRVGIDTIVAGPVQPTSLGLAEAGLVLGGEPAGRIGQRSSIGQTTRLGLRPFEVEHSKKFCGSK